MSSLQEYWDSLPIITRSYMAAVLGTVGLTQFGFLSPMKIVLFWEPVLKNFELWRILTNFCYFGKPSFMLLMQLMLLGRFGSGYENDPFRTGVSETADFIFCLMFIITILAAGSYALTLPMLSNSLIFALIYLWSRRNPTSPVSVWGFRLTGTNLPWAFLGLGALMGNSLIPDILGLAASHLYYFLVEVLPMKTGNDYLTTPSFVNSLAEYITGNRIYGNVDRERTRRNENPWSQEQSASASTSTNSNRPTRTQHNWGSGNRLGGT